jgi:hypothetical protein
MDHQYSTRPVRGGSSGALKIAAALLAVACWLGDTASALAATYYVDGPTPRLAPIPVPAPRRSRTAQSRRRLPPGLPQAIR